MAVRICCAHGACVALSKGGWLFLGGKYVYPSVRVVKDTGYFTVCFAQTFHVSLGL